MAKSTLPTNQKNKKPSNRRRKKRRTEDFSSSSESSSSSSSDSDSESGIVQETINETNDNIDPENINVDDIELDIEEKPSKFAPEDLTYEQKQKLSKIPFTETSISSITNINPQIALKNIPNINEITTQLDKSKQEINNEFLKIMTNEFNNDLDELRTKPDFKQTSLITLAKALQSGSNMFDYEIVKGLLQEEEKEKEESKIIQT
ncbi:RSA3 [Candida pseudojiufengensis]|uniref:RSA3 n=1 Tax=Candida pseudojiufengensis TaxID=497109 RepID=UPI0022248421|nr:RSA3 [Candida pseudojiufengensis]KAI5966535.1 RSA3 [Candida pseudojiufengensis]